MGLDEHFTRIKSKKKRNTSMYLSEAERKGVIALLGDSPLILLEYYVRKAGTPNFEYTDQKAADTLGYSMRKVLDLRLKLTKAGYFKQVKTKLPAGNAVVITYLGKDAVNDQKSIFRTAAQFKPEVP